MSYDYSSLASTAAGLIAKFGGPVTLHLFTEGSYDPINGTVQDTETDIVTRGVKLNFNNRDIDGTMIKQGDFRLLIDGEHVFGKDDSVTVEGVRYQVINSEPLKTGDTRLITKAQCRL